MMRVQARVEAEEKARRMGAWFGGRANRMLGRGEWFGAFPGAFGLGRAQPQRRGTSP